MLPKHVLLLWLAIVNITAIGLFLYALLRLPRSGHQRAFLAFLIPYSIWANGLFAIQLVGAEDSLSRTISQSIFASGSFYHLILGYLLISLAAPARIKSPIFALLALNTACVGVLAFGGLWEEGVSFDSITGLAPIPSPLLWYFNTSLLLWAVYYFSTVIMSYRGMKERDILRCQLRVLVWPAVFSMTMSLTTNVIIPGMTGNYSLTAIGGFWLFVFFAAIAYIIKLGKIILLYQAVRDFELRVPIECGFSYENLAELVRASIGRSQVIAGLYTDSGLKPIAPPTPS